MNIVKATSLITAALLAAGAQAGAQEVPANSPVTYLRPVTFPVLASVPSSVRCGNGCVGYYAGHGL